MYYAYLSIPDAVKSKNEKSLKKHKSQKKVNNTGCGFSSSNDLQVRHFNFGVAWLSHNRRTTRNHQQLLSFNIKLNRYQRPRMKPKTLKFSLLNTVKLSDLQWVEDCKQILKSDGVFIDGHNAKHPGQAKQWQENNHSFHTSPAGKQHNISCHNSIEHVKNVARVKQTGAAWAN